jgi:hypothetical protein
MKILVRSGFLFAAALVLDATARANVLVVSATGGAPYIDIQSAVDAATNGDTILVKSGTYDSFFIANKALVVVADTNANVIVNNGVQVRSLAVDRDVVLAGMTLHGDPNATDWHGNGLYLKSDLGSVRIRCTIYGATSAMASFTQPTFAGAQVVSCSDVAFEGSSLHGGVTSYATGAGLDATGSHIAMYDTSAYGGSGLPADCASETGAFGGAGVTLASSFLFASNATFQGGAGGNGVQGILCGGWPGNGGNGGAGILIASSTPGSDAELLNVQLVGASGGFGGFGGLFNGDPGQPGSPSVVADGSTLNTLSGPQRSMTAASVVRELAPLALSFHGQLGDTVGVYIATSTAFHFLPAQEGVKLVSADHAPVYAALLGSADASGNLSTNLSFPDLGTGVQSKEIYLQAIVITSQGSRILGSPISVTVLDSAF